MAFKGDIEALVLGVLSSGERHGYEISRKIRELSDTVLAFGDAQLYPVLHNLEREGFVEARWEPTEGKPPRKLYRLTETGRSALVQHKQKWERFVLGVNRILNQEASHA